MKITGGPMQLEFQTHVNLSFLEAESQKDIKICDKLRQLCRYAFTSGAEIRKIKVPVETPEWHTASEILKLQMK